MELQSGLQALPTHVFTSLQRNSKPLRAKFVSLNLDENQSVCVVVIVIVDTFIS